MLVLAIVLAVAAMAAYVIVPGLMIYWATPWPVYAMLVASVAVASTSRKRGWTRRLTIGGTALITALFLVYTLALSRIHPGQMAVRPGDSFVEFTLPTSSGGTFSPSRIAGRSAALYVFYRGDW